jgi:catechol 2,3-dioxygenase-like lactoylglutathione lyase family enzyme
MKGIALFMAGLTVGGLLTLAGQAQDREVAGLNHVGLVVADYPKALDYYTKTLGFREAYTMRRPDGSPLLTYVQVNRTTFIELIPATPGQATGLTHFGVDYGNLDAAVAGLRRRGAEVGDVALTPARARFVRVNDPGGVQIELMEFGPESMQRKAIEAWKP